MNERTTLRFYLLPDKLISVTEYSRRRNLKIKQCVFHLFKFLSLPSLLSCADAELGFPMRSFEHSQNICAFFPCMIDCCVMIIEFDRDFLWPFLPIDPREATHANNAGQSTYYFRLSKIFCSLSCSLIGFDSRPNGGLYLEAADYISERE